MAFLDYRKKKNKGKKQWSICESRRIDGKPKSIIIQYLGTAESILKKYKEDIESGDIKSYSHGDTHALLRIANELDIINIINRHMPKKVKKNGMSVGSSLLMAAIGRICKPTSKRGWSDWGKNTSIAYLMKGFIDLEKLNSDHFYRQMIALPLNAIASIEEEIVKNIIDKYEIKPDLQLCDYTNFYTYIHTTNTRSTLAQRGRNKQKRYDLRQFSMSMVTDKLNQFPLYHKVYKGNQNDSKTFKTQFKDIKKRLQNIFDNKKELTMVFDKGNNSKSNFKMIDEQKDYYYIGSLSTSAFKDYVQRANKESEEIIFDEEPLTVFRKQLDVWGKRRTVIIYISLELLDGQVRGLFLNLDKCEKALLQYQEELIDMKKTPTAKQIKSKVENLIIGKYSKDIIKYKVKKVKGRYTFEYVYDEDYIEYLINDKLGKIILVTNRHKWSTQEIIKAYRGQAYIENIFRNLKNTFHMAVRPNYHYIDHNVEVHVFCCIIGYMLAVAAYTEAKAKAKYKYSISKLFDDLRNIRIAAAKKINKKGKVAWNFQLEQMSGNEEILCKALDITNENIKIKMEI